MPILKHLTLPFALGTLASCAYPAQPAQMIPAQPLTANTHKGSVSIEVAGGEPTSPLGVARISDAAFGAALKHTVEENQVFGAVGLSGETDYALRIIFINQGLPQSGGHMEMTLTTFWELRHKDAQEPIWSDYVVTRYRATLGDAFVAKTRWQLATEGAGRENLRKGLRLLSENMQARSMLSRNL